MDLPIPGGPPTSTTLPCTRPPPSTRSTSDTPHFIRGAGSGSSVTDSAVGLPVPDLLAIVTRPGWGSGASVTSSIVFQAWHDGHLPNHPWQTAPHSRHSNLVRGALDLAMGGR